MHRSDSSQRFGRSGSILVAVLLLGMSCFSASALCLASASRSLRDFNYLADSLQRENLAAQALLLTRRYFLSWAQSQGPHAGKNPSPVERVPATALAAMEESTGGAVVECTIIDLYYSDSFVAEALARGIPHGVPSVISVGEPPSFLARRYELRAAVTLDHAPGRKYVLCEGLVLLTRGEGEIMVLRLYLSRLQ